MKRDRSVDILKGIGILLVLFGHTIIPYEVSSWIYGFHMPLFFFASGFFAKDNGFWCSMQKNCSCIIIPWLFFFVCYSLMTITVTILHSGDVLGSLLALKDRYNFLDEDSLWYPTIWFLVCLLILKTIDALWWCVVKRTRVRLVFGVGIYVLSQYIKLPFFIDSAMAMFFFYEVGRIFHINGWNQRRVHWSVPLVIIGLYSTYIHISLPVVDIKHNDYPFYLPLIACPIIWALYHVSKLIDANAASFIKDQLSHFGRSSLVLFGLHQTLWIVMFPISSHISYKWMHPFFMVIPTIPILLYTEKIIFNYCPIVLGKRENKIHRK